MVVVVGLEACVGLRRILVIDESAAIRETLAILLGGKYEVSSTTFAEFLSAVPQESLDLIIAGSGEQAGEASARFPFGVPVLWLGADDGGTLPAAPVDLLRHRFSPHELRRRVDDLLAAPSLARPADRARLRLEPPFVPVEASRIVKQALAHDLPLCLFGEPGVGKRSVARAIHALRGGGPFLAVRGEAFLAHPLSVEPARNATLFVDRVDRMDEEGQQRLLALLEPGSVALGPAATRVRVVTAAEDDLGPLVDQARFSRELYHRLTVLSAFLPPLRVRSPDVPALAQTLARELCQGLGVAAVQFSPAALERLSRYLWFGNVAELEAVVARTLSLNRRALIDADDLLFESGSPARTAAADPPATPPRAVVPPVPEARRQVVAPDVLDLIINELAHEFKNPMVTIKTFAQHLRRFLQNGASEEEVARLTGEAVDQMDHILENLVQFTRFAAPVFGSVPLGEALSEAVEQVSTLPGATPGRVDYRPMPALAVCADRPQLIYAFSNLLRTVLRGVPPRQPLVVHHREPADVVILLPPGSDPLGGQLAELLSPGATGEPPLPLGIAIARALIERNGGTIAFEPIREPTTITVRLSLARGEEVSLGANGKSARSDH